MKTKLLYIAALFVAAMNINAQGAWTQKANFGGTVRQQSAGFSIGTKGYIGTGRATNGSSWPCYKDFWEYDPLSNTWTQKADFGGSPRFFAIGFAIGSKGYIGIGRDTSDGSKGDTKDFWEYDPGANTWTQKANFGGSTRFSAVGFAIDSKGYVGTGWHYNGTYFGVSSYTDTKDFWEYDPGTDTWTQKANFDGGLRSFAIGFSILSKGYVGTGSEVTNKKDFWEYNPVTDTWTQKADFDGTARYGAVGFAIGSKGYIGTGQDGTNKKDFWEYDPGTDTWIQKADFDGTARSFPVGFAIGNKGYIGTGLDGISETKDFWEYDPAGISNTTGISLEENQKNNSSIYPNPFSTNATIVVNSELSLPAGQAGMQNTELKIYDALGKEIKSIGNGQLTVGNNKTEIKIERNNLPAGVYFYKLTTGYEQIAEGKLMIE